MNRSLSQPPHLTVLVLFLVLLLAAALCLPLPLYLASLAVFGLPHVVWEFGFLRSRYAGRWPMRWWGPLWTVLILQAVARGAAWLGVWPADSSRIIDLLGLFLLALLLAFAPMRCSALARVAGLVLAAAVMWLLEQGDIVAALLMLAIAHNFTPLAMAWDMAREDRRARALAWTVTGLFLLPLLVAGSGWQGASLPPMLASHAWALDGQLPAVAGVLQRQALLSALVLSQCLHYYCVIVLLPRAQAQRSGSAVLSLPVRRLLMLTAILLLTYYLHDFSGARQLYGVAAGVHAWLEWPLLLMALLGTPGRAATSEGGTMSALQERNTG